MKKTILLICICFLIGYAKQNKIDLIISFGRDCIAYHKSPYYYDNYLSSMLYTSDFSPLTANALFALPISDVIRIGLRAGYSGQPFIYIVKTDTNLPPWGSDYQQRLIGSYFQALGLINTFLCENKLSVNAGIGFGFYNYNIKYKYRNQSISKEDKTKTSGFAQTFLFGCDLRVADNIKLAITFEKLGINSIIYKWSAYNSFGDIIGERESGYLSISGFQDVGITMGIVFSL